MKPKTMVFNGLGFPVVLVNVRTKETQHGEALDFNMNDLEAMVFEALIRKPARFSGAELKFVRHVMELTQAVLADLLGDVDRSAVAKWEAKDLKPTGMSAATELMVRVQMIRHLKRSLDKEFPYLEPAIRKKDVGKPLELAV